MESSNSAAKPQICVANLLLTPDAFSLLGGAGL